MGMRFGWRGMRKMRRGWIRRGWEIVLAERGWAQLRGEHSPANESSLTPGQDTGELEPVA